MTFNVSGVILCVLLCIKEHYFVLQVEGEIIIQIVLENDRRKNRNNFVLLKSFLIKKINKK